MRDKRPTKTVDLTRVLSKLGFCSRSQAFALIRDGNVRLNGTIPHNPSVPVRLGVDKIQVAGQSVGAAEKLYVIMNKPRGILTTVSDEKRRDTVYSLLPKGMEWIAPVGRLDKASEGLLLLTNDSEWAARITDPESHLDKTYHVQISATVGESILGKADSPRGDTNGRSPTRQASGSRTQRRKE
jgi:23S rRNA pseudouridine2605 synthase